MMLIYCDSVIPMYFFDHTGPFNVRATNRLAALAAAGDRIAISDLVRLEYRVKPVKNGDTTKLALFDAFCAQPEVHVVPITTAVFDRATVIRATHNFKLADSLHLAAAVEAGCDRFLTNDSRLAAFTDIAVEVLA
jgi:predicted nucleic acid-binding protein